MKISLLGSTGSIGTSTLSVVRQHRGRFTVTGLAAGTNVELLAEQIREFKPQVVCLGAAAACDRLVRMFRHERKPECVAGDDGLRMLATLSQADIVVQAISGAAGLLSTVAAVQAGKRIGLANKESLVMAGELIIADAQRTGSRIIPVDSEHSALFQLLNGRRTQDVQSLILTASGGPFRTHAPEALQRVTPEEALRHPRWKMGRKITTDSASLMNKGLEVIEAHWLFGVPAHKIQVVIHPESIIHAMIAFVDGTVMAQLSYPDMQAPIAYALSYPERLEGVVPPLTFTKLGALTFHEPDMARFPSLRLAYDALAAGGLMPAVMNAANEIAVKKFHEHVISFTDIPRLTGAVMERCDLRGVVTLETVLHADAWARTQAEQIAREGI